VTNYRDYWAELSDYDTREKLHDLSKKKWCPGQLRAGGCGA